jgi:tetratricopeptide (TPR) repeat protein
MAAALGEWDRRIGALEARVARDIGGASAERAFQLHVELGLTYHERGRLEDALRQFDAASTVRRSASDVHVLRALTLDAIGRPDDARAAWLRAWNADPRNPVKAYYVLRQPAGLEAADRERARTALANAYGLLLPQPPRPRSAPFLRLGVIADNLSAVPVVGDAVMAEGFALLIANQYDAAIAALRQAAAAPPAGAQGSPLVHFALGRGDEVANRIAEARRQYEAALRGTLAGRSVLYVALGRLAQVDGDFAAAVGFWQSAVRLHPNDANLRKQLASAFAGADRMDDAFAELVAALLIDPGDAQAHAAIGQIFLDTARESQAVDSLKRALELSPERFETHYALATALKRLGRTDDAERELAVFERALREAQDRHRRQIASDVEQEEALRERLRGALPDDSRGR